eukprot:SAG11_NODE_257_length_11556_cov_8.547176_3_plen_98_part_00
MLCARTRATSSPLGMSKVLPWTFPKGLSAQTRHNMRLKAKYHPKRAQNNACDTREKCRRSYRIARRSYAGRISPNPEHDLHARRKDGSTDVRVSYMT